MMKKWSKVYLLLTLSYFSAFLCSCREREILTEDELKAYVMDGDNGLLKKIEYEEFILDCFYWPKELILLNEYRNSSDVSDSSLNMTKKRLDSIDYFIVKYSPKRNTDRFINSLNIRNDAQLVIDNDTIQIEDFISIPRQNSGSQAYSILYAFKSFLNKRNKEKNVYLIINNGNEGEEVEFSNNNILEVQNFSIIK